MSPEELLKKWRPVVHATKWIWSWSGDLELSYWAEQASNAKHIIEIGTHYGRSAKVMLMANPDAHLWCIDAFLQDGTYHFAQHFLKDEIQEGRCSVIKAYAGEAVPLFSDASFDLVMIDNGHEKPEVQEQIQLFMPKLRSKGLMCGHDLDRNPDNGVTLAVKESLPNFYEPVSRVWAYNKP